jgi:hypothetical protein
VNQTRLNWSLYSWTRQRSGNFYNGLGFNIHGELSTCCFCSEAFENWLEVNPVSLPTPTAYSDDVECSSQGPRPGKLWRAPAIQGQTPSYALHNYQPTTSMTIGTPQQLHIFQCSPGQYPSEPRSNPSLEQQLPLPDNQTILGGNSSRLRNLSSVNPANSETGYPQSQNGSVYVQGKKIVVMIQEKPTIGTK